MMSVIDAYTECDSDLSEEHKQKILDLKNEIDLEFLKEDLPELIRSCQEGTERTKNIVLDLKNFSRLEEAVINNVDLPREIDTTLNILHNKFKNKITVHKEYQENLPHVEGYGGQLNQVFMNILDNAAFAIQEKGDVWIRLKADTQKAIIEFEDNGVGMEEKVLKKVFDPFFTTKAVGQGTGLGMAISYKVIKNHNGNITIKSEEGKGTKFVIELPLKMGTKANG
jgi:two-component system NtrC family sensor kinase